MKNISTVVKLSSIVCIGGMLTACSTSNHSRASYQDSNSGAYSSTRMDTTADTSMRMSESRQSDTYVSEASGSNRQYSESQEIVIPLHEERLNVGKQTVEAGQVRLRKVVTTETVNRPVELRRETVVIERVDSNGQVQQLGQTQGSAQADRNSSRSLSQPFEQGEITIRLSEERPVVEKETVVTGRVVARKASETDRQSISREIRREDVRLDRSGDTANINVKGEFREAAGAENSRQQSDLNQNNADANIDASVNTSTRTETSTTIQSNQPVLQTNPNAEIPDARGNSRNNPAVETSPTSNDNRQ